MIVKRPWRFIRNWGGLGNFVDSDCVVAAYFHILMALAVLNGSTFKKILYRLGFRVPHTPFALKEYTAYLATLGQKPGPESGVGVDGWLNWQKAQGNVLDWCYVGKPGQPVSESALRSAIDNFGGVLGVGCLTDFAYRHSRKTWFLRTGDQPDPSIGHALALLDYNKAADRGVTWGHWQGMTIPYRELCFNALLVFVHKDDPNAQLKLKILQTMSSQ